MQRLLLICTLISTLAGLGVLFLFLQSAMAIPRARLSENELQEVEKLNRIVLDFRAENDSLLSKVPREQSTSPLLSSPDPVEMAQYRDLHFQLYRLAYLEVSRRKDREALRHFIEAGLMNTSVSESNFRKYVPSEIRGGTLTEGKWVELVNYSRAKSLEAEYRVVAINLVKAMN
jgi:hypothetical protein